MTDYYTRYVKLCEKTHWIVNEPYMHIVRQHNRAMKKLYELGLKMYQETDRCQEVASLLLEHESEKVRINIAAYCIQAQIHVSRAYGVLTELSHHDDRGIAFDAKHAIKYLKPWD